MVIISHDRRFLDKICTHIVSIEKGFSRTYIGNYSNYIEQKNLEKGKLESKIKAIYKDKITINNLETNSQLLSKPNATKEIVKNILELIS